MFALSDVQTRVDLINCLIANTQGVWVNIWMDELGDCYKLFYFLLITNETRQAIRSREQLEDHTGLTCHFWEHWTSVWVFTLWSPNWEYQEPLPRLKKIEIPNTWLKNTLRELSSTIAIVTLSISISFLPQYQRRRKRLFLEARAGKGIAWNIDASNVVRTLIGNGSQSDCEISSCDKIIFSSHLAVFYWKSAKLIGSLAVNYSLIDNDPALLFTLIYA